MGLTKISVLLLCFLLASCAEGKKEGVLQVSPVNNRYLELRGEPLILMGSTEHYGAVLNLDFDYIPYLDELQRCGLNLTRTFTGIYVEPDGAFGIEKNTLAPAPGRLITPFARSNEPGYANGGNKFDLSKWDVAYFERLKDFVAQADKRDIIVEITLFSSIYNETHWAVNPQNPENNINGLPEIHYTAVHSLEQKEYLFYQENMVRKIVTELNGFDNVYFEIFNEPYADQIPDEWHHHMARLVAETESGLKKQHVISYNYANNYALIDSLPACYSLVNFHYAKPRAVLLNRHLNVPIGDNETGFMGNDDWPYRVEAWSFLFAGGALFNHLDYSFAMGHESGNFVYPRSQPGGGNAGLRKQFGFLRHFLEEMDFTRMHPDTVTVQSVSDQKIRSQTFSLAEEKYLVYLFKEWTLVNEKVSIRFTGDFEVSYTGEHTFSTVSDDGVRLWVDNTLLIDDWKDQAATANSGSISLKAGEQVPLRLDYYNNLYGGSVKLIWSTSETEDKVLDRSDFFLPGSDDRGIRVEYHLGIEFDQQTRIDTIEYINHDVTDFYVVDSPYIGLSASLKLVLPQGTYLVEWLSPRNGDVLSSETINHHGGELTVHSMTFDYDALLVVCKK